MLPIVQSLWIGDPLSNLEKLCIQSFLDNGHEFHVYVYDDVQGIPDGATIKDGNEILPESEIFRNNNGSVAGFSDYFRFALLAKRGGFWVDMDFVCIKPFCFDSDIVFGVSGRPTGYMTGAIMFPTKHPVMLQLQQQCADMKNKEGSKYNSLAQLFEKSIGANNLGKYAKPFLYFYPYGIENAMSAFDDSFRDGCHLYPNTYAVHLWCNRMPYKTGFDKNSNFAENSLIEQLKTKHGITSKPGASTIESADIAAMFVEMEKASRSKRKAKEKRRKKRNLVIYIALIAVSAFLLFFGG